MNYSVYFKGESYIDELGKGKDIVIKTDEPFIPWESDAVTDECSEVVSEKNGWKIIVHKEEIRKLHTISGNVFYYKNAEMNGEKFVTITLLTGEEIDINVNWIDYDLETKLVTISKDGKTYCLFISPKDNIVNDCGDEERINKAEVRYAGDYCYGERICY